MDAVVWIDLWAAIPFGLAWLGVVAVLRFRKRRTPLYLILFSLFYVYVYKVLDYTLLQFQSLILAKYFMPNLILRGTETGKSLNLIPLVTLSTQDVQTSLLNVLLFVPLGFGLPFITELRMKSIVVIGLLFSAAIELLQLATGLIASVAFRIADVNDVIFNTMGAAIGYILFLGFVRGYRRLTRDWKISRGSISRYIAERPQASEPHG